MTPGRPTWGARGTSAILRGVGPGTGDRGVFTLDLLGKGPGGTADRNHGSMSRSMAPTREDEDSILGDTYYDETGRRRGRQVIKQVGNKAVEESCSK